MNKTLIALLFAGFGLAPRTTYADLAASFLAERVEFKVPAFRPQELPKSAIPAALEGKPAYAGLDGADDELRKLYEKLAQNGWSDEELIEFYKAMSEAGTADTLAGAFEQAVLNPTMPSKDHSGDTFFNGLAWYFDRDQNGRDGDGLFTLRELDASLEAQAREYLSALKAADESRDNKEKQENATFRVGAWKLIQKLRMLRNKITQSKDSAGAFAYKPVKVDRDSDDEWNKTNTISDAKDFSDRVCEASKKKPVILKFGLTYCAHCKLMEGMGSVKAVAKKYRETFDTYKLWWNAKNESYGWANRIAHAEGVEYSPRFIVYKGGKRFRCDYAFPDEKGSGLEDCLSRDFDRGPDDGLCGH